MRASLSNCALLAALLASPATGARADELLVMPYACAVVGGRPVLTPSQDEGHRVIGRREQRDVTTCSPRDPEMCRRWTVHRFDIDCGGQRVPWSAVVGGAQPERTWFENGQLHVRMPARWDMAPDDPCARLSDYDARWPHHRVRRYCAERRSMGPQPSVAMPQGFAPMLGIGGVFVATAQGPLASQPVAPAAQPLPAPRDPSRRFARQEPPRPAPPAEAAKASEKTPAAARAPRTTARAAAAAESRLVRGVMPG